MPTNNRPKVVRTTDHRERLWITFDTGYTEVAHPQDKFFVRGIGKLDAAMVQVGQTVTGITGDMTVASIEEIPGE